MPVNRDSVAKLAKVSSATVSRVYNTPEKVSQELRGQVLDAANILGYLPNSAAATLRRKQTGILAFVEFSKEGRPYYWGRLNSFDWFFGRAIRGVQQVLGQTSWQLRFYTVKTKRELEVIASQCDGILAYDVDTEEEATMFDRLQVPSVLAHHLSCEGQEHCVTTDNFQGGVLQGTYLKEKGCRKPLYITGYLDTVFPHAQRLSGFVSLYPDTLVFSTEIDNLSHMDALVSRVKQAIEKSGIDSLACVNDMTLFSLLMRMPLNLPLVGYDASPLFSLFPREVASVDIRSADLYREAASQLLSLVSNEPKKSRTVVPLLSYFGQKQ
ncbi:MAG: LacI family transcriptional regulator [Spirochaetia bacterium]|nr:LacI family transcriptional regulator [Spirochaetia bacterium]